jgi:hypothetical protein
VVAIKLLHPELGGSAEEQKQRLQREAQAMARVSHHNLVTVFDVGTHEGQVFIAMEYVAGVTLKQWLGPRRAWSDIVRMFCGAGRGLAAAHAAGLVHRDFKPANVLVGDDGIPQVLDFGLVRRAGEVDPATREDDGDGPAPREDTLALDLTRTGSVMGTPAYMAPEQHLGQPTDARSDQFSFCVALYEALYGRRPFPGEEAGKLTVAVLENLREPRPRRTEVPRDLYRVLDRGLSREPSDRFPSMEPLIEALMGVVDEQTARPARPRWLLAAGIALLVALGAGLAVTLVPRPRVATPAPDAPAPARPDAGGRREPVTRPPLATAPATATDSPAPTAAPGAEVALTSASPSPGTSRPGRDDARPVSDRGTALPSIADEAAPDHADSGEARSPAGDEPKKPEPAAPEPEKDAAPVEPKVGE